jgi:tetratricopeptide (TPR) repeat protein
MKFLVNKVSLVALNLFVCGLFLACAKQEDEASLFFDIQTQIELGKYNQAENMFDTLLKNYQYSDKIGSYYLAQDQLFVKMLNSYPQNKKDKKKPNAPYKKGTVTIGYGAKYERTVEVLQEKRINELEEYLERCPNDIHRELVLELIIMIYTKKDKSKILNAANELANSDNITRRSYGLFFTAIIAHSDNELKKAISHYKELIKTCTEINDKAKYQLYLTDCYYRLGNHNLAMSSLNEVMILEKELEVKYMSRMAELWRDYYVIEFNKPSEERAQFIYFK